MIEIGTYKILHMAAVLGLFGALGAVAVHAGNGLQRGQNALRRSVSALHGLSLLLILVSGFGMLARLDVGLPGWALAKLVVWFVAGGLLAVPYRAPERAVAVLWALPVLGGIAAWLAVAKPF